ncbi:hypothetical protein NPIL_377341 [Nephila pilipes]|uniref:Uncharacterized protein n=1 Tax=Nephila pilipes TaxID=299642 RepID=A0A8X6UFT9_NEPPI|nr:hypothetical protein NPIL_377341 [Nephila pilipes]
MMGMISKPTASSSVDHDEFGSARFQTGSRFPGFLDTRWFGSIGYQIIRIVNQWVGGGRGVTLRNISRFSYQLWFTERMIVEGRWAIVR